MWMNYVPGHARDHADSEYVTYAGIDRKGASLSVTNTQSLDII